ncbi:hypothetical protein D9M71_633900 [compost metagenome]
MNTNQIQALRNHRITPEQAAAENYFDQQIDNKDANVLLDYAAYVGEQVSEEQLRNLLFAMLQCDDRVRNFMMAQIKGHSRLLHAALDGLAHDIEKLRGGFIEHAAKAALKELEQ